MPAARADRRPPADDGAAPRRTGRPRAGGRAPTGDPTDEILAAAARLFGRDGVGGTTMSAVAAEVGLQQSSLYYYFRRKEQIIAELVARANVVPLHQVRRITAEGGPPAAQLHRFVREDVVALCGLPFDINEVHRIAARDTEGFADYWKERATLERLLARIVRDGINDGSFRRVDARLTAVSVLATDEGVQNWYRLGSRWKPAAIGRSMADLVVGGLLCALERLDEVRAQVADLDRLSIGN